MKDTHEERKRRWESKSNEMNAEWKRLAEMSPEEYLAEFKGRLKVPIGHARLEHCATSDWSIS